MRMRFGRGRDAIKRALDRRYLTRAELGATIDASNVTVRLVALEAEIALLRSSVSSLQVSLDSMGANVRDVERLAGECARAIERLLQEELLVKRDLDRVTGA
ncbi:MAG TPA: hypothetical protein VG872_02835 [Acidimicrobiia bacterium]|jgi:hypothetical protein|nr:hypothetical protein [Acidimicrobiia bacterium]